jgi:transcriptional regulator with XRE-family HTH domain
MELKDILRELRTQKKLTQSEIAERIGLKTNTYQSYEHGSAEPSCSTLKALADFYGVTTDYLLGREPAPNPFADLGLDEAGEQEMLRQYMSFEPEVRAMLMDVLIKLADSAKPDEPDEIIEETTIGAELDRRSALTDDEAKETAG